MPTAWRIVKTRLAGSAFDGEGARLHGGRWNSPGTRVVYTSESVSLALLEILVHLRAATALPTYSLISVRLDDAQVTALDRGRLPAAWRAFPAPAELARLGDAWAAAGGSLALEVPSAVVPRESNYLLNPGHPDFAALAIPPSEPFTLDLRLVGPVHGALRP
jgi:RES domain-containing protein